MEKLKGIIFDFNGTLLWDTELHNRSWDAFLARHKVSITDREKHEKLHGRTNQEILEYLLKRKLGDVEMENLIEEKETIYRNLCVTTGLRLAEGCPEILDFCTEKGIPIAIATSSNKKNVDFFVERFDLLKWFEPEGIVFHQGTMKSKPDPEIFETAGRYLKLPPSQTLVFEDSIAGVLAAERFRAGKIVIVNSNGETYPFQDYLILNRFQDFDRSSLSAE